MFLTQHTIIIQNTSDVFLLYQVLTRKGIYVDGSTFAALQQRMNAKGCESLPKPRFRDISTFSLSDCLLDNPSGIYDEREASAALQQDSWGALEGKLKEYAIVAADDSYIEQIGKRTSFFDKTHGGNFHQQIGDFLMRNAGKISPEQWWVRQKFEDDLSGPRPTLYLSAQHIFLDKFFTDLSDQEWLDFGCGIGFYSRFFALKGARVYGVDPSELYIRMAKENFSVPQQTSFDVRVFNKSSDLEALAGHSFDAIFMSDVFLYYFEPYHATLQLKPAELLKGLGRLLKPGGRLYIMDPHGCFHLQSWWGARQPFLICPEYRHRKFRVTPTLEEVSLAAEDAGLEICRIRECYSAAELPGRAQASAVGREFPLWWFFELKKASEGRKDR